MEPMPAPELSCEGLPRNVVATYRLQVVGPDGLTESERHVAELEAKVESLKNDLRAALKRERASRKK